VAPAAAAIIAVVSRSVLLVDDDPEFRRLARCLLREDGLAVVGEADTVATAIAAAHELRPEAVLVDVGLPDGSGIDLARALSALPWRPRIVLTSTDPHAAGAEDVRSSGARSFIAKYQLPDAQLERVLAEP
jgi:DNA-binding NarL/FixJ family response regulator